MTSQPLDPATIMADHAQHRAGRYGDCMVTGQAIEVHCDTYRLAVELAAVAVERDELVMQLQNNRGRIKPRVLGGYGFDVGAA